MAILKLVSDLLRSDENLKTALRKLVADNIAGVLFDFFSFMDGTSNPNEEISKWTQLTFVDTADNIEPINEMLHG